MWVGFRVSPGESWAEGRQEAELEEGMGRGRREKDGCPRRELIHNHRLGNRYSLTSAGGGYGHIQGPWGPT
eukprot:9216108-Pyramimonas_sp.AAC.1